MSYDYTAWKKSFECLSGLGALGKIKIVSTVSHRQSSGALPPLEEETRRENYMWTARQSGRQSGRPIFDDFFQHLWPYIGNNTANVVFQMVKRLWLIRIDQ
ncbi:hypothetical protein TNCV_1404251 [Trichonephila clavipes]|nr:hypothetical protein TNCV_1404251 [Trichonephila clavipes]